MNNVTNYGFQCDQCDYVTQSEDDHIVTEDGEYLCLMCQNKKHYREAGYTEEKDFPGEYYFMFNPETCRRVRLYYNGLIIAEPMIELDFQPYSGKV